MTANAGYKTFNTGDVLTAAQVQYNLQNQSVMYFATTTARDAALTGSILVDGMVSYTPATGLMYYNGTAWTAVSGGTVPTSYGYAAGKNPVINGHMGVWQRGTSIAVGASAKTFTADRWWGSRASSVAGETVSRQSTSDTTNLPTIQYCARVQRDLGNTGTQYLALTQDFETATSIPFAGKSVAVSFYARAGANYSSASNALTLSLITGTGTDQTLSTGYTGQTTAITGTATLTTTWQRFTYTGTIAATATQIGYQVYYTPVGTALTSDYFEITGLQVEANATATQFQTATGTVQGELAACQRYYYVVGGVANQYPIVSGNLSGTGSQIRTPIKYGVTMRVAPTITKNGTWNVSSNTNQPSAVFIGTEGFSIEISSASGAIPAAYAYPDTSDDSFTCSAEL